MMFKWLKMSSFLFFYPRLVCVCVCVSGFPTGDGGNLAFESPHFLLSNRKGVSFLQELLCYIVESTLLGRKSPTGEVEFYYSRIGILEICENIG